MSDKKISIELPEYIKSIFQNSSIDGNIDYLKSIFDDRNFNINAFYTLNFEVYKGLLLDKKYYDKDFLKIKRNLFYCSNARLIIEEIDFSLSKYYNTEDFIEKELNNSGTEFDKFCTLIFKEESKGVLKYLKKLKGINEILKNKIINNEISLLLKDFINKDELFNLIINLFSKDELIKIIISSGYTINKNILIFLSSNRGLKYLSNLNLEKEVFETIYQSTKIGRPHLLDYILEFDNIDNIIKFFDIDDKLIDGFENFNDYLFFLQSLFRNKKTLAYLEKLGLSIYIFKEKNRNFNWLVEKLSGNEQGKIYLNEINKKQNNKYINDFLLKIEENESNIKKTNNIDTTKEVLEKIKKGKIKLDDGLYQILRSEEGIKFLEENYESEKISKELIKNSRLFTSICNTDYGVEYLKKLNLDGEFIKIINSQKEILSGGLLDIYLDSKYGIDYLKYINKNDVIKNIIINSNLGLGSFKIENLENFKGLGLKERFILQLQGKTRIYMGGFGDLFNKLIQINGGVDCIIEANIINKTRKYLLNGKDYQYLNSILIISNELRGKQYLKDILNLETDNIKNQVYNFIKTSDSGSCLLSGYRGTGKTSLLNIVIKKLQDNSEEEIVKVVVNIPEQQKDKNGKNKSFNKNELITKIIRQVYLSLLVKGYSKNDLDNFEDQYIRTFKNIDEIEGNLKVTRKLGYKIIIQIISFSFSFVFGLLLTYLLPFLLKISGINISEFFLKVDNIKLYLVIILITLNYFIFITVFNIKFKGRLERTLYNEDIAEYKLNENIGVFSQTKSIFSKITKIFTKKYYFKDIFEIFIISLKNIGKTKKRKIVVIIDELDKLLDLDKGIGNGNIDMKDIFDLLGKLKTLFFDNTGAIFFVVTNKDAYNYYLENKHSEDDLISNIFNKVLYLPMIKKENFNINRTFKIDGIPENNKNIDDIIIINNIKNNEYFNDWIYYKSHGNWRKANFILNQKLNNQVIELDKEEIEYEMKFYDFMNLLYNLFSEKGAESDKQKFDNNFVPGKDFYEFIDEFILSGEYSVTRDYKDDYQGIIKKVIESLKFLKSDIYKSDIHIKINELTRKYINSEAFDTFAYIHSSVDKISNQPAYKDYVINSILNLIEILKHDRTLRIEDILVKLKFTEIDVKYPAFEDLVLVYIPLMIYYFNNINDND